MKFLLQLVSVEKNKKTKNTAVEKASVKFLIQCFILLKSGNKKTEKVDQI